MFSSLDAEDLNPLKQTFYHLLIITRSLTGTAINQISDWNKVCVLQENCRKGNITVNLLWYSRGVISQWGQVVASWLYDLNSWIAVLCLLFDDAGFLLFYIWYILDPGSARSLNVCPCRMILAVIKVGVQERCHVENLSRNAICCKEPMIIAGKERLYFCTLSSIYTWDIFQVHRKSQNM